jgi:hypothetical protein
MGRSFCIRLSLDVGKNSGKSRALKRVFKYKRKNLKRVVEIWKKARNSQNQAKKICIVFFNKKADDFVYNADILILLNVLQTITLSCDNFFKGWLVRSCDQDNVNYPTAATHVLKENSTLKTIKEEF